MSNDNNNVSENLETTTTIDTAQTSMSKKNNKLVPIVIVALVIVAILGGGFYYYFSRPSKVVSGLINSAYNNFSSSLNKTNDFDFKKDTIRVSGDLNIDTNMDGLEDLKKETFEYTLGLDFKNKTVEVGGALKEGKTTILDIIAYVIDEDAYISLKDDYKDLIHVDPSDADIDLEDLWDLENIELSTDDIDYIAKEFKDILIESIDMDALEKTSATTKIDGKSVSVSKITYNLNEKNTKKLEKNIINNTLENDDLIEKISKITDIDTDDIIDELKDALDEIKDEEIDGMGKVNIYTKGLLNDVVKVELVNEDGKFGYVVNKNNTEIYFEGDSTKITFAINENSDEKLDVDYSIKVDDKKASGNITITNEKTKKDVQKGSVSFSLKYDDYKINVKSNYKAEYGVKIADINTKNAVDANKLQSDTKLLKAIEDITKRLEKSSIYEIFESVTTNSYSSYSNNINNSSYSYDEDDDDDSYTYSYDDDDYSFDF